MKKIIQLIAPASPVFAVFTESGKQRPTSEEDLFFVTCPVLALVQDSIGEKSVVGLIVQTWGVDEPSGRNFLGYAATKEQAVGEYASLILTAATS